VRNRFSRPSDDEGVKSNRRARSLDDRTVDALLSGRAVEGEPELTAFVADVQALRSAPTPSDALAAMLANGVTPVAGPAVVPARRNRRPVQVAAVIGAALGLVVSAGAANALPGPVQNGVSDVVGWVTPVDLPRDDHHGRGADDVNDQGDDHGTGVEPGDDKGGDGATEPGDDKGSSGSDDSTSGDDSGSSGSGSSGSDDGTSSGSGSDDSGYGSSDSGSGSSGSGSSGSGSGGSDDGSDDRSGSATPTPTRSPSPRPSPTPTEDHSDSGSDD
jgi:hypothetical protein